MESKCPIFTDKCPFLNEYKQKCPHYNKELPRDGDRSKCPFLSKKCPYLNELMEKCPHYSTD